MRKRPVKAKSKPSKEVCSICEENEITNMPNLGICVTCYNGMYYWRNKSVKQVVQRQKKLEIYQRRMALMKGSNR